MNKSVSYSQRYDGVGFEVPNTERYLMACCDCGLVHDFVFAAESGESIGIAAKRNEEETAYRRENFHKVANLLPERQVKQFVSRYFRDTKSGRLREVEALKKLINEVYAQGVEAGKPKQEINHDRK